MLRDVLFNRKLITNCFRNSVVVVVYLLVARPFVVSIVASVYKHFLVAAERIGSHGVDMTTRLMLLPIGG